MPTLTDIEADLEILILEDLDFEIPCDIYSRHLPVPPPSAEWGEVLSCGCTFNVCDECHDNAQRIGRGMCPLCVTPGVTVIFFTSLK